MTLCRLSAKPSGTSAGEVRAGYACLGLVADEPLALYPHVRTLLNNPDHYAELLFSVISAWEFSKLLEKKRIEISCDPEEWFRVALKMSKLRLVPLTPTLSYRSTTLPSAVSRRSGRSNHCRNRERREYDRADRRHSHPAIQAHAHALVISNKAASA